MVWRRPRLDGKISAVTRILPLAALLALTAPYALAQVRVDPAALGQLAGPPAAPPPQAKPVPAVAAPVPHAVHHHHAAPATRPAAPVPPAGPAPAPPPPASATPAQTKILPPVRISFAPGTADLPASAGSALKPFCAAGGVITIAAHAPANPSDPSAAMRLSLTRALAVKAVLAACGVPVQNIVPRAASAPPGHDDDAAVVTLGAGAATP